ncbi:helix-turn-helix domain-containing protein [Pseudomonas sp. O64]|uniref:helix-turn-helix domain-containing protein n=1 Tax=unclassified Pseudomonas TaxID=196821 RepID=UPI0021D9F7E6|nr:helix-turn-helix domain-containing protein [Pseudomonas sp. YeP6b]UXZ20354.1 helix-turn-helix domain-containing protein [Pseudomonas sp. YeP6b]
MAKKFAEFQASMTLEARAETEQLFRQPLKEMPLHELRKAQQLSQERLAKALNINQAAVSKMERRTDMYISTLRDYIRAMGGELEIIATFPGGRVKIDNFAY